MSFKKYREFINEEFFFTPNVSTNRNEDQTSLKQAYPDAENASDNDAWNSSIINKNAEEDGDVAFVSRKDKTKGGSIDTFGNRTKEDRPGGGSIYGQSGVAESTELEVGIEVEMEHTDDRKEAEKIAKDHISEDPKYYSKLYKAGLIDEPKAEKLAKELDESFDDFTINENLAAVGGMLASTTAMLGSRRGMDSGTGKFSLGKWLKSFIDDIKIKRIVKRLAKDPEIIDLVKRNTYFMKDGRMAYSNLTGIRKILKDKLEPDEMKYIKIGWGPRLRKVIDFELDEGGLGDNEVAGQRVYTQTVDKSKQGYQDSMYYDDPEFDDHGPDCDCPDCQYSTDDLVDRK